MKLEKEFSEHSSSINLVFAIHLLLDCQKVLLIGNSAMGLGSEKEFVSLQFES